MRRSNRLAWLRLVCFALFPLTVALLAIDTAAEPKIDTRKPIRIGVVYGLSGPAQNWSESGRMGLELAKDEINGSGGVGSRKIELVYEDSKTIPAQSVAAFQKLTAVDQVSAVIGNVWSFITNPMVPLALKEKTLLISPTVMPESIEGGNEYVFSMGARVSGIAGAVNEFFAVNKDVKKVGIFCWEDAWGRSHLKVWREVAARNGVEIVQELCNSDFTSDYRSDVSRMIAAKPDAVILSHIGDVVLRRMKEQRFAPKVLATSNLNEEIKFKKSPAELFEGVYMTDWWPNENFVERFKARFEQEPLLEAHNSYEALRSLAKALSANGTDLKTGLRAVKYDGVAGPIDFSSSQFGNLSEAKLYRVQGGAIVPAR